MTTASALVTQVRANIREITADLRTDVQIRQWLEDAINDYIIAVPADSVPELLATTITATNAINRPADFIKFSHVTVNHTISGTTVVTNDPAYIMRTDERYLAENWPGGVGAWCQLRAGIIYFGPNAYGATVEYIGKPGEIASSDGATFPLDLEHEPPIVDYATAKALRQSNDADAEFYEKRYETRIRAEMEKYGPTLQVERKK